MTRLAALLPGRISSQLIALMLLAVVMFNVMMAVGILALHTFNAPPPRPWQLFGPPPPPPGISAGPVIATVVFLTASLGVLGIWATRSLVAPLQTFAAAAERYSALDDTVDFAETGPGEIRQLARALNAMQARIFQLTAERTRMLAAVGHDLRTPITRLRLRAEFMDDLSERRRMLADLDHMEAMVRSALSLLRDGSGDETEIVADLPSLLQSVCDDFSDLGVEIPFHGPAHLALRVRPHALRRAVTNLMENAVRYGDAPRVHIARLHDGSVHIDVSDSGPGIPAELRDRMVATFVRGDAARSMNDSEGFGLGLGIALTIAEAHQGRLDLLGAEPQGLIARISLPAMRVIGA